MNVLTSTEPPIRLNGHDIRTLVRHRDGYQCTECGMGAAEHLLRHGRNLDVHRLEPGSRYTISGCVTLCIGCHKGKPKSERGKGRRRRTLGITGPLADATRAYARQTGRSYTAVIRMALLAFLTDRGFWP